MINTIVFYAFSVLIVVLSLILISVINSYRRLTSEFCQLSQSKTKLKKKDKEKIIKKAEAKIEADLEQLLSELFGRLEGTSASQIEKFRIDLQNEVTRFRSTVDEKMGQEFKQVQAEIEEYKQKRFQQIDEQVSLLVKEVSKKALGKSIALRDHEKLVLEAVEKLEKPNT